MYKNKLLLILLVILMIAVGLAALTACKPPEEDPEDNDVDVIELPVPIDQIDAIAVKEGTIPLIFRIGDELDYETAKLLVTLKVPEPEEGEDENEESEPEEEEAEPPLEIALEEFMVFDFSTDEAGLYVMRIVYSDSAPQFDIDYDYEVVSETTCFVEYNLNGGAFGANVNDRFDSEVGIPEIPVPIREHYDFEGWYTDIEFDSDVLDAVSAGVQSDVSLYARWTPITYTLTFEAQYLNVNTTNYTVKSGIIELPIISTDGIEQGDFELEPESLAFAGWYESDSYPTNGRKLTFSAENPANKTFYAKWEPKVTVTLNAGFETRYPQGAAVSTVAATTTRLTVTDYYGVVINNNVAVTSAMVSDFVSDTPGEHKLTITYRYGTLDYTIEVDYEVTESDILYLSYVLNEGAFESEPLDRFTKGEEFSELPVPERTAYTFAGWYTSDKFTANTLRESFPANYTTLKTTLYAKWTATSYTVSYYLNQDTAFEHTDSYTILGAVTLWEGAERPAYHFMGWYTNQNYIGSSVEQIDVGNHGDQAFYAKWGAKVTSVQITSADEFNVKDGQMQLTAEVLPGGADPAVYPDVTYYYVIDSELYGDKPKNTGIQYNEDKIIENGIFIADYFGYAVIKAVADGVESAPMLILVILEDVEEIIVTNSPLVVFPGVATKITLDFEPFTAVADLPITYKISLVDGESPPEVPVRVQVSTTGIISVGESYSDFNFTVTITYGSGVNEVVKDVVFNVPKTISNKDELNDVRYNLSGYYVLTEDIDLAGMDWTPIGYAEQVGNKLNYDNAFKGMFFGGSNASGEPYRIKNLTIDAANVTYITAGLFGSVDYAHIEGVILENISITGEFAAGTDYIGGIAGANRLSEIIDCTVTGEIDIDNGKYVGGLVGQMYGSMQNVKTFIDNEGTEFDSELSITVRSALADLSVGGLVGYFLSGTIENADVVVSISIEDCLGVKAGGIAGEATDRLSDSVVNAVISVTEDGTVKTNQIKVGGVVGTTAESVARIDVAADITVTGKGLVYAGGIAGSAADIIDCQATEFKVNIISSDKSWIGGIAGAANTITDAVVLITKFSIVTADTANTGGIVGSASGDIASICTVDTVGGEDVSVSAKTVNFGGIAGSTTAAIRGEFEALNCAINLSSDNIVNAGGIAGISTADIWGTAEIVSISVTAKTAYVGGIAGKADTLIQSVFAAESITVSANISGSSVFVGGIAGYAANIANSSVVCQTIDIVANDACAGGIVGQITHTVTNSSSETVIDCRVKKAGTASFAGGIAGKIGGSNILAVIDGCIANVEIKAISEATGNVYIGGIAGQATADISGSSAAGAIDADSNKNGALVGGSSIYAGGLIGQLNYAKAGQVNIGSLIDSFAAVDIIAKAIGDKAGSVYVGGIAGHNKCAIERCFSDSDEITAYAYDKVYAGGFAGWNEVASNSPALIVDCYASDGEITIDMSASGDTGYAGGFVGYNSGTINTSYAKMKLNCTARGSGKTLSIGGFAGVNALNIAASFALNFADTGHPVSVQAYAYESATIYVGGFAGANSGASDKLAATITDAYTTANVAADAYTGGFVGSNNAYGKISYALSLGEVNNGIGGSMAGAFASRGLVGYTKCYYSTTAAGTVMSPIAEGSAQAVEGNSDSTLRNNSNLYSDFDSEVWTVTKGSFPTIVFNPEVWTIGQGGAFVLIPR